MIECKDLLFRKSQWEWFSDLILITDNKLITNESFVWFAKRTSESFGHELQLFNFVLFCSTQFFFISSRWFLWMDGCSLLTGREAAGRTESTSLLPGSVNTVSTLFERLFLSLMTSQALSLLSPCFSSLAFPSLTRSTNVSQFTCKSHLFPKLFITDSTACVRRYVFVCRSAGYSALIEARCPF